MCETSQLADYFEAAVKDSLKFSHLGECAKQIANLIINKRVDPKQTVPSQLVQLIIASKSSTITDLVLIGKLVDRVISENEKMVQDYLGGKEVLINPLKGMVLKLEPHADVAVVTSILLEKLSSLKGS